MRTSSLLLSVSVLALSVVACSAAPTKSGFDNDSSSPDNGTTGGDPSSDNSNNNSNNGGFGPNGPSSTGDTDSGAPAETSGQVDKTASCDTGLAIDDANAASFAKALGICTMASSDGFGLVSATYSKAFGSTTAPVAGQWGLLPKFGSVIVPREGATLAAISNGFAREYDNINGTQGTSKNGDPPSGDFVMGAPLYKNDPVDTGNGITQGTMTGAAPPGFPQTAQGCAQNNNVNDMIDVKLTLTAPKDATGFQFDFDFYSSEWPNYVCSSFNDAFTAYITSQKTTGNISFDSNKNPVAVNNDFFNRCTPNTAVGCLSQDGAQPNAPITTAACQGGVNELEGTGYADAATTACSASQTASLGGATGWLTTAAPINPGETFTLEFMIWDAGDGALDSSVLLDNFQWIGGQAVPTTPSTSRVN